MRAWIWVGLLLFAGVPALAAPVKARAPARAAAPTTVVAFTGWIPIFFGMGDSGVVRMVEDLKERGITAEVHDPAHWASVGAELVGPRRPPGPVVLVGYSMGAGAVTQLAAVLGQAGIPVRALIVLEAYNPTPVPGNVGAVTHYYTTSSATPMVPGPGYGGAIQNIDLRGRVSGIESYDHVGMSKLKAVQDIVVGDVVRYAKTGGRR